MMTWSSECSFAIDNAMNDVAFVPACTLTVLNRGGTVCTHRAMLQYHPFYFLSIPTSFLFKYTSLLSFKV